MSGDVGDGIRDGKDLIGFRVRDFNAEFFFDSHDNFDGI